ncbi:MAG: hypothetical protein KDA61_16880, partial [Planctomycetales bacterium]|nr:hypothetical protein [Planctomycetales bacterium]
MAIEHFPGYQARDEHVVDYQFYELPPTGLKFRGPAPRLQPGDYVSCLGAAQTLGCLCAGPFPQLLADKIGVATLNLGYGGAGPRFFNRHPAVLDLVNRGKFAVVQIMSGRSEDCSKFSSLGLEQLVRRRDSRRFSADEAWRDIRGVGYAEHSRTNALPVMVGSRWTGFRALRPDGLTLVYDDITASADYGGE